jgi:hypothetical protein
MAFGQTIRYASNSRGIAPGFDENGLRPVETPETLKRRSPETLKRRSAETLKRRSAETLKG